MLTTIGLSDHRSNHAPVLSVRDLKKYFPVQGGLFGRKQVGCVRAIDGVSFDIRPGETLGLVGESGSGKSTIGKTILRLYEPTDGTIRVLGKDLTHLRDRDMTGIRREMQMIFQDPYSSLDPRMKVSEIIGEALDIHGLARGQARRDRIAQLLQVVGLDPEVANRLPQEFSGGQRQRIGIARALAVEPKFIVCDEAISALDVSIQAQIINLLQRLQRQLGLTYLFIAHDLGVVRHISDRVAVLYLGKIVEIADRDSLYQRPLHPYTRALLSAVPVPDPKVERRRERIILKGELPSPLNPPVGCRFSTRCPHALDVCRKVEPVLEQGGPDQHVACHRWRELLSDAHSKPFKTSAS